MCRGNRGRFRRGAAGIEKGGLNLLTCYKPRKWRIKLLQMALQIEICSTTEPRQGRSGHRNIGTSERQGCFFADQRG